VSELHLSVALESTGWHPASWREPGARADELFTAAFWHDTVREAERGLLTSSPSRTPSDSRAATSGRPTTAPTASPVAWTRCSSRPGWLW
jgi:hypothetical protein